MEEIILSDFNVVELFLRGAGAFFTLLLLTRIMGKKQISQLTYFNYVTGITIGSMAGDMMSETDIPFWYGLGSMVWWTILTIAVGFISLKFPKTRQPIDGEPTIIINKGVLEEKVLRSSRITLEDVGMMLRNKGVFSITEVDYAIIEANGKLSVLKKQNERFPAGKGLRLPRELIVDGRVIEENMDNLDLSEKWLQSNLSGLALEEVFYAQLQSDGSLYYQRKEQ